MLEITDYSLINTFSEYKVTKNSFNKIIGYFFNNNIIGYIDYSVMYEKAEINYIFILKEYRKLNYASKLLEYMFEDCKNNSVVSITLEVKNGNDAINLYKKFNFKEIGVRKNYYNGIDGILMEAVIK